MRRLQGDLTRRSVLRAGVGLTAGGALGACGLLTDDPAPPPAPDPLAGLLADTVELIGRYDAALAAVPDLAARLAPVRAAHAAHAAELARLLGAGTPTPPAGSAPPTGGPPLDARGALAALRAAEQAGRRAATQACLAAPAERAPLLGSIAAARACHGEVLA